MIPIGARNMPAIADQSLPLNATSRQIASVVAIEARIAHFAGGHR